jgi:hypothetical protein
METVFFPCKISLNEGHLLVFVARIVINNVSVNQIKRYIFCLMVEASDHGHVLHTRCIYVFSINDG